jgi:TolB-like protein/tetratricopeptide (TPR) repeat protein
MNMANPAIFLSYAREDAPAARRIAEALRAAGLEVWFDENELRGGDAWDAKIRKQIDACALFLPIISHHTQARGKGYFRLEWKLAVEQTHLMAEGMAYLAPVVIDDTLESGALVPPEFLKVQWTRLPGALPTPQFVAQIQRLLESPAAGSTPVSRPSSGAKAVTSVPTAGSQPKSRTPLVVAGGLVIGVAAVAVYFFLKPDASVAKSPATPVEPPTAAKPAASSAAENKSIAVLPFVNMSGDKESEYFSDGLTEEVLNALARNPALRVAARTSSFAFKGKSVPMDEIGRALRAASVIEGSVRKDGSRVRITVQLINAADGYHVWSETFTREMTDIFAVQDEIAAKVAQKLGGVAAATVGVPSTVAPTKNLAAYDLYLRARAAQNNGASEQTLETVRLYEQVLRADPDYAQAWAQLADVCADIFGRGLDSSNEMVVKARSAANAALRLAPNLPETHLALARVAQFIDRDPEAARRELEIVERLRPNEPELPAARVRLAYSTGQWGDSLIALVNKAVEADPQNATMLNAMAGILTSIGRWAEAETLYDRALSAGVGTDVAIRGKVSNLIVWTNDAAAALALVEKTPESARNTSRFYNQRAHIRMQLGDYDAAIADFERYRTVMKENYSTRSGPRSMGVNSILSIAEIETLRGNSARATQALDEALLEAQAYRRDFPELAGRLASTAFILARRGQATEAVAFIDALLRQALDSRDVPEIMSRRRSRAAVLAILGRNDEALAELQIVHASGYAFGYSLRRNDDYRSLSTDPRFQKLMAEAEARAYGQLRPKR